MIVEKLTTEAVERAAFATTSGGYYLLESGGRGAVNGFGVRVRLSQKHYVLRHRDYPHKIPGGLVGVMPLEEAREQARVLLLQLLGGEEVITSTRHTMRDLREQHLARHARPKNSPQWARDQAAMWERHVLPFRLQDGRQLGFMHVRGVHADHLSQLHAAMAPTPRLANLVLSMLSTAFNLAKLWRWRRPHDANPTEGIQRYPERSRRARFFSAAEYEAWGRAVADAYAAYDEALATRLQGPGGHLGGWLGRGGILMPAAVGCCELRVYTGARPTEGRTLRWEWLEWSAEEQHGELAYRGRFRLPTAKGDRPGDEETGRSLWLNGPAFDVLRRMACYQGHEGAGFSTAGPVFPGIGRHRRRPIAGVQKTWARLCSSAGIVGASPNTLRHSFVTEGTRAGVPRELMQDLAGHATPDITDRVYRGRLDDQQVMAAERMGRHLSGMMQQEGGI